MDNFYTYVIKNKIRNKIYLGYSNDLENRIKRHNHILKNKKTSFTSKNSGFWELAYYEIFNNKSDALKREKELKSFKGRGFIKSIIKKTRAVSSVGRATAF